MIVVFNYSAVAVGILTALAFAGITSLFPALAEAGGAQEAFALGIVAFLIGAIAEGAELRPRLFFLPFWLVGLGISGIGAWVAWGPVVWACMAVPVFGVGLLMAVSFHTANQQWAAAPGALAQARSAFATGDHQSGWSQLSCALHVPVLDRYSGEICRHNLEVIRLVHDALPVSASETTVACLSELSSILEAGAASDEPIAVERTHATWLRELIAARGELPSTPRTLNRGVD